MSSTPLHFNGLVTPESMERLAYDYDSLVPEDTEQKSLGVLKLINVDNELPGGGPMVERSGYFEVHELVDNPVNAKFVVNGMLVYFSSARRDTTSVASRLEIQGDSTGEWYVFTSTPLAS